MAVRLVECGFTGEVDSVSAIYGRILSSTFDPDRVVDKLGTEWLIARSYFKLHPTGRYVHSAIDALEDLLRKVPGGRLNPTQIARIEVRAYMLAAMLANKEITTSFGARFSVPFALASLIIHGRSGLDSFDERAVANPAVQALARRVDVAEDKAFTARYPDEQPVSLRITLRDGTNYEGECRITKGEPSNPHTADDLRGKFLELGEQVWGRATTQSLFASLMQLEDIPDFAKFADTLTL